MISSRVPTKKQWITSVFGMAISALLVACTFQNVIKSERGTPSTQTNPSLVETNSAYGEVVGAPMLLMGMSQELIGLYAQTHRGVVAIRALTSGSASLGSGMIIDQEGYVLTNAHVLAAQQEEVEVFFISGYKTRGKIIGTDPISDLAVIEVSVPQDEIHPLRWGDSDQVKIGQVVVALGNPYGLQGVMTLGIVSGLGRTLQSLNLESDERLQSITEVIQTDAAINPGSSGGALLNLEGEVVGVIAQVLTGGLGQGQVGVGFAVSSNLAQRIVPFLIEEGKFTYPYLGISSLGELTLVEQEALGLPLGTGVYITKVHPGSPAEKAGLHAGERITNLPGVRAGGDLIIAVDGHPVVNFNDLMLYLIKMKRPGDTIYLTVLRGAEQLEISLVLGEKP